MLQEEMTSSHICLTILVNEAVWLFSRIRCLLNFHWDAGRQGIDYYSVYLRQLTCIHVPLIMYCLRLFVVVLQVYILLNRTLFVGSGSFISVPSLSVLRLVSYASWNQYRIIFNTFLGHIIYPFLNQRYLLSTCMHSIC